MFALGAKLPARTTGYTVGDDSTLYKLPYARKLHAELGGDLTRVVKVLIRGAYVVQSREIVTPAPVEFAPCTCGVTAAGRIGGHADTCKAMIETRAADAARAAQWATDHPPVFTPHTPETRAQWERDIIAQGGTPALVQAAQPYEIDCEEEDTSAAKWWLPVPVATVTPVAAPRGAYVRRFNYETSWEPKPFWLAQCDAHNFPGHTPGTILLNSGHHYNTAESAQLCADLHNSTEHKTIDRTHRNAN